MLVNPADEFDADPSSLSPALRKAYSRGTALAAEAESYMPPQTYPGSIIHCLIFSEDESSIILDCAWESGLEISLSLPLSSAETEAPTAE